VAQRLQQRRTPQALRRAEQHRHAEALAVSRARSWSTVWVRRLVHQQLLEQLVVMVGKLLEHVGARLGFALLELGRDLDPLGLLPGR
jgi:hypothetical protein